MVQYDCTTAAGLRDAISTTMEPDAPFRGRRFGNLLSKPNRTGGTIQDDLTRPSVGEEAVIAKNNLAHLRLTGERQKNDICLGYDISK